MATSQEIAGASRPSDQTSWFGKTLTRRQTNLLAIRLLAVLAVASAVILSVSTGWVMVVNVSGQSMFPTIHDGDVLITVSKEPKPGDIVSARVSSEELVVKRLNREGGLDSENSKVFSQYFASSEVEEILGVKLFTVPTHFLWGTRPEIDGLLWSPDGLRIAYLSMGKIFLREKRRGFARTRQLSDEDVASFDWLEDGNILATDYYGTSSLIKLDEKNSAKKALAVSAPLLPEEADDVLSAFKEEHPEAVCVRWLDRDHEVIWASYSIPYGVHNKWVSFEYRLRTGEVIRSHDGVSEIFPSGVAPRYVLLMRNGGCCYQLHDANSTRKLGQNVVFDWARDGSKLAWAVEGQIHVREWK